jgi:hypothetical protein
MGVENFATVCQMSERRATSLIQLCERVGLSRAEYPAPAILLNVFRRKTIFIK